VPALDRLRGLRIVAEPAAIDVMLALLQARTTVVRIAPDEAFVGGVTAVTVDDPHAIIEEEVGFAALTVDRDVFERHVEWSLPPQGGVGQGSVAGVPAKVAWLPDGRARVVTQVAYAAELQDRLR
jgi:hypothetical protein